MVDYNFLQMGSKNIVVLNIISVYQNSLQNMSLHCLLYSIFSTNLINNFVNNNVTWMTELYVFFGDNMLASFQNYAICNVLDRGAI